jgi:Uncharacterized conserved protein
MENTYRFLSGTPILYAMILIGSGFIIISNIDTAYGAYEFSFKWGSFGSRDGQLHAPLGIALDSSINIFVSDTGNDRIQKFRLSNPCPPGTTQIVAGVCLVTKWGQHGSGIGQFANQIGVTVDRLGNVYVADTGNDRIQKFTNAGVFIRAWGSTGSGDGQFNSPIGVAVDPSGNVYVSDQGNHRIQKFGSSGNFIRAWGPPGPGDTLTGIDVDSAGNVFVADAGNERILKFTNSGIFIKTWGQSGTGDGQFRAASGVDVTPSGNVFVVDFGNHRIQKFTNDGTFITKWGSLGTADGQFQAPGDVGAVFLGVDIFSERVFVADTNNHRIEVFKWKPVTQGLVEALENNTAVEGLENNTAVLNGLDNYTSTSNDTSNVTK